MARRRWWQTSRTREQARRGSVLWLVLAAAMWCVVLTTEAAGWQVVLALAWTVLAVLSVLTWRRWRAEWDER